MLDPSYLAGCAEDVAKLFAKLEADITADIAARGCEDGSVFRHFAMAGDEASRSVRCIRYVQPHAQKVQTKNLKRHQNYIRPRE